jgi:glycosyltransferase involved in cell wall biosynthesis
MTQLLCIVFSSLGIGGIPVMIVDIVNRMKETQPKTKIYILLKKHPAFDLRTTIINHNVTILSFCQRWPFNNSLVFVFWVWVHILALNPFAILSFISPFALTVLATKILFFWRRTPVVINEGHYASTMIRSMKLPAVQSWGIRLLYPLAGAITVPTRAVGKDLENSFGVPSSKIHVVGNWSKYAGKPLAETKRPYDCIYVGRFEKTKNILPILSLLSAIIRRSAPALTCLLIGDGSQTGAYEKYIQQHHLTKNIQILPPTADFVTYLRRSKILIYNPDINTEGFPVAVLDAMACGTIVITKYFYGVTEVLSRSNGYIVHSDKDMGGRIKEVLETYPAQGAVIKLAKKHVAAYNSLANIRIYTQLFHGKIS